MSRNPSRGGWRASRALLCLVLVLALGVLAAPASLADAGDILLASADAAGSEGNGNSELPDISANGRYIAFQSAATDLVTPATTGTQVFRKDLITGAIVLVSATAAGTEGNGNSIAPSISADGRFVAFESAATNLMTPATTGTQVFRKDLDSGEIVLVSADAAGTEGNGNSQEAGINWNGAYVAFQSAATNLVTPATTGTQVFRKDLVGAEVLLVSADAAGTEGNGNSLDPSISADGLYVAFESAATNLVTPATTGTQVFRKDLVGAEVLLVSADAAGTEGNGNSSDPAINYTGRYVAFTSAATNLVTPATVLAQIFRKDVNTGAVSLVSATAAGLEVNAASAAAAIDAAGRYVSFHSAATDVVAPATTDFQVFRKDMETQEVILVSATAAGANGNSDSFFPSLAANGRLCGFQSAATDLVTPATTNVQVFRKELAISPIWYFAEGTTRPGFDPYFTIQNAQAAESQVQITYMKGDATQRVDLFAVPANSRSTVRIADWLGVANDAAHDFSARIESLNGVEVTCERPMYFDYTFGGVSYPGGHDVVGANFPAPAWYFAEGTTRPGFDPYLTIQNPEAAAATVEVTYLKGDATQQTETLTVAANSRSTIRVVDSLGQANDAAHDFSTLIRSTNGVDIICERPMYFDYTFGGVSYPGGHDVLGTLNPVLSSYFSEGTTRPGFDPYFTVQNPHGTAANVRITYMLGDSTSQQQDVAIAANSRGTVRVADLLGVADDVAHDFSARVDSLNGVGIIVERPMYFNYTFGGVAYAGGSDILGASSASPRWFFAEGTTRPGFDPYLAIQNPGAAAADVRITYMLGDATQQQQTFSIPAATRSTVRVVDILGTAFDSAHDFSALVETTNGTDIICERPMYFDYTYGGVSYQGGHDVAGVLP
ncbi:MAG: TolB family protein [Candidatus Geothermincolia bacterium]